MIFAADSAAIKAGIALLPPSEQEAAAKKLYNQLSAHVISVYPKLLDAIARLTSRSSSGAFVLTPDTSCAEIYRWAKASDSPKVTPKGLKAYLQLQKAVLFHR